MRRLLFISSAALVLSACGGGGAEVAEINND